MSEQEFSQLDKKIILLSSVGIFIILGFIFILNELEIRDNEIILLKSQKSYLEQKFAEQLEKEKQDKITEMYSHMRECLDWKETATGKYTTVLECQKWADAVNNGATE